MADDKLAIIELVPRAVNDRRPSSKMPQKSGPYPTPPIEPHGEARAPANPPHYHLLLAAHCTKLNTRTPPISTSETFRRSP